MSVQSETNKIKATLTSLNQVISLNGLYFQEDSDIKVVSLSPGGTETPRVLTTDYTLTGAGDINYGNLIVVGGTIGDTWYIIRDTPLTQLIGWIQEGGFSTNNVQTATDKLTVITQQIMELLNRTLNYPVSEPTTTESELPVKSVRANGYLFFDADGNPAISPLESNRTSIVLESSATATGGQTVFTCPAHDVGLNNIAVYVNGVRLRSSDFSETSTTSITLNNGLLAGDEVDILVNETQYVAPTVATLANEATPTVEGSYNFLTGGTTTITDFDDGAVGQTIRIKAKHSLTITDGIPIELNGGSNFNMVSGDTLTLTQFESGVWSEVARSVN